MERRGIGWLIAFVAVAGIGGAVYYMSESRPKTPLAATASSPAIKTVPAAPATAETEIEAKISRLLPNASGTVSAWFRQEGIRVLPQSREGDEGELRTIGPITATKVSGKRDVVWPSHRFSADDKATLCHLTDGTDLVKEEIVSFEKGSIRVKASDFPTDGKWHLFCLSVEDPLGTSEYEREVFCVQRVPGDGGLAELLLQGCIAEAWADAVETNLADDQLRSIVFMACAQTELLSQDAHGAIGANLRKKHHAFLLHDLTSVSSALDSRKQALLQRLSLAK